MSPFPAVTLPDLSGKTESERTEADERRDRIKFHRDHVRNGPVKFKDLSNGQVRRARQRALRAMTKRARKNQVATFFAQRQAQAALRHRLQAVALIPFVNPEHTVTEPVAHAAALWLVAHFGDQEAIAEQGLTIDIVEVAFLNALNRYEQLAGLPVSEDLPEDYSVVD